MDPPLDVSQLLVLRKVTRAVGVVHFLVIHVTLSRRPGIPRLREGFRFPLTASGLDKFPGLPMHCATAP